MGVGKWVDMQVWVRIGRFLGTRTSTGSICDNKKHFRFNNKSVDLQCSKCELCKQILQWTIDRFIAGQHYGFLGRLRWSEYELTDRKNCLEYGRWLRLSNVKLGVGFWYSLQVEFGNRRRMAAEDRPRYACRCICRTAARQFYGCLVLQFTCCELSRRTNQRAFVWIDFSVHIWVRVWVSRLQCSGACWAICVFSR